MSKLRKLAKGKPCQVRIAGVCNHNSETTVLAHLRLAGISGMGIKAPDWFGAWACSACHAHVDAHHDAETKNDFYEGIFRTQAALLKEGETVRG
jgi:hypothetical protein